MIYEQIRDKNGTQTVIYGRLKVTDPKMFFLQSFLMEYKNKLIEGTSGKVYILYI
jgi:hypothetical protein